jgi:hypothetical protein
MTEVEEVEVEGKVAEEEQCLTLSTMLLAIGLLRLMLRSQHIRLHRREKRLRLLDHNSSHRLRRHHNQGHLLLLSTGS